MVARFRNLFVLLLMLVSLQASAELTARFDRDSLRINETVELILETDALFQGAPQLDDLERHFDIINQSTTQNVSVVNGEQSIVQRHIVSLRAKDIGSFTIGPIRVGAEQTAPMRVTVLPEQKTASGQQDLFIEISLDSDSVYVQQQIVLTARLFLGLRLLDGSLADPQPAATRVERIGDDKRYQVTRDGKEYSVYERRYALFPQQSGTLEIPPIRFEGIVDDRRNQGQVFGSLFNQGRRVRANGAAQEVTVKPPPAGFNGTTWLPAQAIQLDELGVPVTGSEAGQPITRRVQLQAKGLTAEQLPDIDFGNPAGLRFYPDKAARDTAEVDGSLVGIVQAGVAIVGAREGQVTLPPVRIVWWNTLLDREEVAELPGRDLEFTPSSLADNIPPLVAPDTSAPTESTLPVAETDESVDQSPVSNASLWKWIAIGSIALWLITLTALAFGRRGRLGARTQPDRDPGAESANIASWREAVRSACAGDDPRRARRALLGWAQALNSKQTTLTELSRLIADPGFSAEIQTLERTLYADEAANPGWRGGALWRAVDRMPETENKVPPLNTTTLPTLYPERRSA